MKIKITVHAPSTNFLLAFAPSNQTTLMWEQNQGAKAFAAHKLFRSLKSLVQLSELCYGSMLRETVLGASSLVCLNSRSDAF